MNSSQYVHHACTIIGVVSILILTNETDLESF